MSGKKLLPWIDKRMLDNMTLSENPEAVDFLIKNREKIDWFILLGRNPNVHKFLLKISKHDLAKIKISDLLWNSSLDALEFYENHTGKKISTEIKAIKLKSGNNSQQKDSSLGINWSRLSRNPDAIELLEQNLDKIDWRELSKNTAAMHLLEKNPDKIDWTNLSSNPAAINFLRKNEQKIMWESFSGNLGIFSYGLIKNLHKYKILKTVLINDINSYIADF